MTIMESDDAPKGDIDKEKNIEDKPEESMFSDDNMVHDSVVDAGEAKPDAEPDLIGKNRKTVTITPEDKASFVDAMVGNSRFKKEYSLFGGKIRFIVRSLTTEEVNALSVWMAKKGTSDTAGLVAGRYRKYLMAAQIEMYDGVEMPPLEEPLYETLEGDGKTVREPGWLKRCDRWNDMPVGLFNAIMNCLEDFDTRYSILCKEAGNANFWSPDTP